MLHPQLESRNIVTPERVKCEEERWTTLQRKLKDLDQDQKW
jgi:hypothetical protein